MALLTGTRDDHRRLVVFLAAVGGLYLGLRLSRPHPAWPSWIDHHLADFLCLPSVLSLALLAHRRRRPAAWILPRWHGFLAALLFSWCFEVILPVGLDRGTADVGDAAAYLAGWLCFELTLNRPAATTATCGPGSSHRHSTYAIPGLGS